MTLLSGTYRDPAAHPYWTITIRVGQFATQADAGPIAFELTADGFAPEVNSVGGVDTGSSAQNGVVESLANGRVGSWSPPSMGSPASARA